MTGKRVVDIIGTLRHKTRFWYLLGSFENSRRYDAMQCNAMQYRAIINKIEVNLKLKFKNILPLFIEIEENNCFGDFEYMKSFNVNAVERTKENEDIRSY